MIINLLIYYLQIADERLVQSIYVLFEYLPIIGVFGSMLILNYSTYRILSITFDFMIVKNQQSPLLLPFSIKLKPESTV